MKKSLASEKAPQAIGPYSIGVQSGNLIFISGQLGIDPSTNELVTGGIQAETRQVLTNLNNILVSAGASLEHVVKTTVFLREMADFAQMNTVYAAFFQEPYPARSTIGVAALPKGVAVEIEAIAVLPPA